MSSELNSRESSNRLALRKSDICQYLFFRSRVVKYRALAKFIQCRSNL